MSASVLWFSRYFNAFEDALTDGDWAPVAGCFAADAVYRVVGAPFACTLHGRDAIVAGFQRSTGNFDARLDERLLEIEQITRMHRSELWVNLISGYGRDGAPPLRLPVAMRVRFSGREIAELTDHYQPEYIAGGLHWMVSHAADLNPAYTA
ncbi:MAG: nuclear transport factor 2 family protein [Pseudomonadota bacterium]